MTSQVPFTLIIPTAYGQMLVNRHDINQTNSLFKTGRSLDHDEILLLARLLQSGKPNPIVADVGANFGAYSLGLAHAVGSHGKIHCFEPQRIIFNMLAGSVALNSLTNVFCYNVAVGDREGMVEIPRFDYNQPLNFGSIEFTSEQREKLTQERARPAADQAEFVPLTTLDRFTFQRLDLLKIDVEGMENQVLDGATQTIKRCRPILFIEFLKVDREALRRRLLAEEYVVEVSHINYLCVPAEQAERIKPLLRRS